MDHEDIVSNVILVCDLDTIVNLRQVCKLYYNITCSISKLLCRRDGFPEKSFYIWSVMHSCVNVTKYTHMICYNTGFVNNMKLIDAIRNENLELVKDLSSNIEAETTINNINIDYRKLIVQTSLVSDNRIIDEISKFLVKIFTDDSNLNNDLGIIFKIRNGHYYSDLIGSVMNTGNLYFINSVWIEDKILLISHVDLISSCRRKEIIFYLLDYPRFTYDQNNNTNISSLDNESLSKEEIFKSKFKENIGKDIADVTLLNMIEIISNNTDGHGVMYAIKLLLNIECTDMCDIIMEKNNVVVNELLSICPYSSESIKWLLKIKDFDNYCYSDILKNVDVDLDLIKYIHLNHPKLLHKIIDIESLIINGKFDCVEYILNKIDHFPIRYGDSTPYSRLLLELSSYSTGVMINIIARMSVDRLRYLLNTYYHKLDWDKLVKYITSSSENYSHTKLLLEIDFNNSNGFNGTLPDRWLYKTDNVVIVSRLDVI